MEPTKLKRRKFLALSGATFLAGCGGGGDTDVSAQPLSQSFSPPSPPPSPPPPPLPLPAPSWSMSPNYSITAGVDSGARPLPVSASGSVITVAWDPSSGPSSQPSWVSLANGVAPTIEFTGVQQSTDSISNMVIAATANGQKVLSSRASVTVSAATSGVAGQINVVAVQLMNVVPGQKNIAFTGKHAAVAWRPKAREMYMFGGDGSDIDGVGHDSGYWHFGRVTYSASGSGNFDNFYPYWGIAGQDVPAGYDFANFAYDKKRDVFWQVGGFQWGPGSIPYDDARWVGNKKQGGVWKFTPGSPGTWQQVTTSAVPNANSEQMMAFYHARTDKIIGLSAAPEGSLWWYDCATGGTGSLAMGLADSRRTGVWGPPGYDEVNDEIFFLAALAGQLIGLSLVNFPNSISTRVVATGLADPGDSAGQMPQIFLPSRRLMVLFGVPNIGITMINVDTGGVTKQAYPAEITSIPSTDGFSFITQAIYDAESDEIRGWTNQAYMRSVRMKWRPM